MSVSIPTDLAGQRLDKALAILYPDFSRTTIQKWLKSGLVSVDDEILSQRQKMDGGEWVEIQLPEQTPPAWAAQDIPLDILHEDDDLLVINKPQGLVVHPGAGNPDGTLMNALLYHDPSLSALPRAGIVHRLDKDTSGLMVVARNEISRLRLIEQLQDRNVNRTYFTIVNGVPLAGGSIDACIGRHPVDRKRMAINLNGKQAISHYRIERKFRNHALLCVNLETGRTHQIRVHMQSIGFPVLGDPVYGKRLIIPGGASEDLVQSLRQFKRQALHALELSFIHPLTQRPFVCRCPLAGDMAEIIILLEKDMAAHG